VISWRTIPHELVRVRPETSKVGPFVAALICAVFTLMALHDLIPWHFMAFGVICIVQLLWPTLLGWLVLTLPATALAVQVIFWYFQGGSSNVGREAPIFFILYSLPVLALWWSIPVKLRRTRPGRDNSG
jgi:hypothetical protein